MSRDELRVEAARLVLARLVADRVKGYADEVRANAESQLEPGEKLKAAMPDGTVVGAIQRTEVPMTVRVDMAELLWWVEDHRPDELIVTKTVRESYVEALRRQCKEHGHAFDPETGEVIPGVELVEGRPSFRVTPNDTARAFIDARYDMVLELPGENAQP